MNRETKSQPAARDDEAGSDTSAQQTPSTDMQPEDTGTADSGNTGVATATDKAMKQQSKTEAEQDRKPSGKG